MHYKTEVESTADAVDPTFQVLQARATLALRGLLTCR